MSLSFEYGEGEPWYPPSELHNWRQEWLAHIAMTGQEELMPMFLVEGEYRQEISERNTTIFLNDVCDPMDALYITDERDETIWRFFRGIHIPFSQLIVTLRPYAQLVQTRCPLPSVEASYYLLQKELDAASNDEVTAIIGDLDDKLSDFFGNNTD